MIHLYEKIVTDRKILIWVCKLSNNKAQINIVTGFKGGKYNHHTFKSNEDLSNLVFKLIKNIKKLGYKKVK